MYTPGKGYEKNICTLLLMLLAAAAVFVCSFSVAYAAGSGSSDKLQFNNTVAYMVTTVVSFILLLGYCAFIKKKDLVFILLFTSVLVINLGYAFLSSSQTLSEALLANKITYFGAVFLPLFMLIIIMDECHYKRNKVFLAVLLAIDLAVLLLVLSPGYSTLYYEEVSLVFINGGAALAKTYGPLHCVYSFFLAFYFIIMIAVIIYAHFRKAKSSPKLAVSLLAVVFANILVWFIEQKIHINFEFLSVSYIITEIYLLSLYSMLDTFYGGASAKTDNAAPVPENTSHTDAAQIGNIDELIENWADAALLTSRELEVLKELLANKKRKDIAEDLCVSENTVKKHTSNIFAKLEVSSRAEIIEKLLPLK
ncbi:MAG: hypothetical protein IJB73_07935 [Firmicutes bacterium]|nr:hypothetical protein [Bacillota bacterium]